MRGRLVFWKILVVCSLLSPIVLFSSKLSPWKSGNYLGWFVQELVTPIRMTWQFSLDRVSEVWLSYLYLVDIRSENTKLKREVEGLRLKLLDYDEKANEIGQLRALLKFTQHYKRDQVIAEVIGQSSQGPFEVIKISKGMVDDLEIGMPVITNEGVLGRVIRVRSHFSEVQLLTDVNFHLDVLLQRSRSRGVLNGAFGGQCTLKLNRRAEIKIGDTLITSGIIGGFPRGIPVGKVVKISYESDNITQIITVDPWVNHMRTERVVVLKTVDEYKKRILNSVGKAWFEKSIDAAQKGAG